MISEDDWNDWRNAGITRAFAERLEQKKSGALTELLGALRTNDTQKAREHVGRMDAIDDVLRELRGGKHG